MELTKTQAIALAKFVAEGLAHPRLLTYWEPDESDCWYVTVRGEKKFLKRKKQVPWTNESADLFSAVNQCVTEDGCCHTGQYIFEKEKTLPVFCKRVLRRAAEKIKEGRTGKAIAKVIKEHPRCEMLLIVEDVQLAIKAIRELIATTPFLSGKNLLRAKKAISELSQVERIRTPLRCL